MMEVNKILNGDCLQHLRELPEKSINMVMTSPPYWALRDYGVDGQIGLEPTFDLYIKHLCDIFDEVKRVLRDDGTIFVNLGDTYFGGGNNRGNNSPISDKQKGNRGAIGQVQMKWDKSYSAKSLCMIPSRFAIEMINRGWILRNTIIWYKPNAMPSSVKDRFTVDFEYIFFFSKNKEYYFETQTESNQTKYKESWGNFRRNKVVGQMADIEMEKEEFDNYRTRGRNKRTVWEINTKPLVEAHFATYPEELCETPIKAGCPEGGIVLDMFFGAGTTGLVALKQNKKFIGIELNPEYIKIAEKRLEPYLTQTKLNYAKDDEFH